MHFTRKHLFISLVTFVLAITQLSWFQVSPANAEEPDLTTKNAMYAKPAIVRVASQCDISIGNPKSEDFKSFTAYIEGSGFFINSRGYIATFAVFNDDNCKELFVEKGELTEAEEATYVIKTQVLLPEDVRPRDAERSRSGGTLVYGGKDVSIIKVPLEKTNAPSLQLGDSDKVQLDSVTIVGYLLPEATEKQTKMFDEQSIDDPSVTEGKVANPNKTIKYQKVFEVSIPSGFDSPGSPILNNQGEVIGIIAPVEEDRIIDWEDNTNANRGIPIAIPASVIKDFVRESSTDNNIGEVDQYYRSGLNLFWKGDYQAAKEKFETVKDLYPQHSEIDRLISECNQNKVDAWKQPSFLFLGVIGAVILAALGFGFFLMRRRSRWASEYVGEDSFSRDDRFSRDDQRHEPTEQPPASVSPVGVGNAPQVIHNNGAKGLPFLELQGRGESRRLQLDRDIVQIGRDPGWSDLKDMPVVWEVFSRRQARLVREGNSYRIFDGDGSTPSRNGLFVGDHTLVGPGGYLLKSGDTLRIGKDDGDKVSITFFDPNASQAFQETKMAGF
jgi:S1-C subfamily serine protease/pSer/pThr/pTyr-binding forkhead associated (FHA) protein